MNTVFDLLKLRDCVFFFFLSKLQEAFKVKCPFNKAVHNGVLIVKNVSAVDSFVKLNIVFFFFFFFLSLFLQEIKKDNTMKL